MTNGHPYAKPLSVEVFDGEVVVTTTDGPVGLSLTPEAAAETAQRLAEAARIARSHQGAHQGSQTGWLDD